LGELVVQTGRLAGSRRPLGAALTFVGNAASCEVRLNGDGVHALHCLLAHGPDGLRLRDLESEGGTFVNGERVSTALLGDGDLLGVGPYQFRVRLPAPPGADGAAANTAEAIHKEKEALRIQAAAVAAQQVALAEEEARLAQRRSTLEEQEGQLAAHLEDKRRRLLQVADHAQTARAALQKERGDYEKHVAKVTSDLGQAQRELLQAQQQAHADRQRLRELRLRLKQRWHRHWTAERQVLRQQEESLAAERRHLEKENERIQQAKDGLLQARLRCNGEMELVKRQIQDGRETLQRERARWQEQHAGSVAELAEYERALAQREAELADGERLLEDERYRWEKGLGLLKRETEGLETRIRNQRRKVVEQRQEINLLEARLLGLRSDAANLPAGPAPVSTVRHSEDGAVAPPVYGPFLPSELEGVGALIPAEVVSLIAQGEPPCAATTLAPAPEPPAVAARQPVAVVQTTPTVDPVPPATPAETPAHSSAELAEALAEKEARLGEAEVTLRRRVALLERLAEELADQRLLLAEQWERLAWWHQDWHSARRAVVAELDALTARLPLREEAVATREATLQAAEKNLRHRCEEAVQLRHYLEGSKARLHIRAAAWESERARTQTDLRSREQLAKKTLAAVVKLRQRWAKRRRQELDLYQNERAACEQLRQECAALRDDLWRRGNALEDERRDLAEKHLAVEQYRQQYVVKAADVAAAERRLERLRRRWVAQNANLVRATVAERQALHEEIARLEDRHSTLHKQMESLTVREANLAQRQSAWEEAQALAEAQQSQLKQELQSMQAQRDRYALHLIELQDEVERIARILLEEPELPLLESQQAA
jgi:hypothetical protein